MHDPREKRRPERAVAGRWNASCALLAIGFGIFWIDLGGHTARRRMALFGLVFIVAAIVGLFYNLTKASQFTEMKRQYEQRRANVLQAIRKLRDAHGTGFDVYEIGLFVVAVVMPSFGGRPHPTVATLRLG